MGVPEEKGALFLVVRGKMKRVHPRDSSVPAPTVFPETTQTFYLRKLKAHCLLFSSSAIVLIPCGRAEMNGNQPDLISAKYSEPEKGALSSRMPTYIPV